jgi:hypothetical protein
MKHKIKKSKTRKKYSKRVSKKVTKRPKKGLKLKKKNSRKNKIKKGGDVTTTIGITAAAAAAVMYIYPRDEDNLEKQSSGSSDYGNNTELVETQKIVSIITTLFGKIKKGKTVTEYEYKNLENLYNRYHHTDWFPLQGTIEDPRVGVEEMKGEDEESFNDRIVRAIKQNVITMN